MSNQGGALDEPLLAMCCSPLAQEPLGPARAVELSLAFEALGEQTQERELT